MSLSIITYTTVYGTRTYQVTMVKTIANNDWSYLQGTVDNRITLTTCLANQPAKRICVQAVEWPRPLAMLAVVSPSHTFTLMPSLGIFTVPMLPSRIRYDNERGTIP